MGSDDLIRLTYASTSASREQGGGTAVDPEVGRILRSCKRNNPRLEIGGVLHYGNGYFFQVLEGPDAAVQHLYANIAGDDRHRDVKTLEKQWIRERRFPDWSMKYVPMENEVEKVLERHGMREFDPYRFDRRMIEEMISLLVGSPAPEQQPDQDYRKSRKRGSWLQRLLGRG